MRALSLTGVLIGLLIASGAGADERTPTAAEARKLFRKPRGSLSVGKTNHGSLLNAVELPLKGRGYAFFGMIEGRRTHFMTADMAGLIRRSAQKVTQRFPDAVLGVGNVANEEGGQVGESVSHQNGRDADLGIFAFDKRGRRINLRAFVSFKEDGWDKRHRYRFDTERNLALVVALMTDPKVQVQWIFIAEWLEERLIRQAWAEGLDEPLIAKLGTVLLQPGDSNPHSEHFHLRIYCSVTDRLHGCLERGPVWDWIDQGEARWRERITALEGVMRMKEATWRRRAAEMLGAIRAEPAIGALVAHLDDPAAKVRQAALNSIELIASEEAVDPLKSKLPKLADARWAARVFKAILRIRTAGADELARAALSDPASALNPAVGGRSLNAIRRYALRFLGRGTEPSAAPLLVRHLKSGDKSVRKAAHKALVELTTQPNEPETWAAWLAEHQSEPWLGWTRQGLARRGHALDGPLDWERTGQLVALLRDRDDIVSYNASKALTRVTGYDVDPRQRTKRNNHRLWRNFFRRLGEFSGPAEPERLSRRAPEPDG